MITVALRLEAAREVVAEAELAFDELPTGGEVKETHDATKARLDAAAVTTKEIQVALTAAKKDLAAGKKKVTTAKAALRAAETKAKTSAKSGGCFLAA